MDPAYPRFKENDPIIECAACHMRVMAKGDWQGWKPVALPDGRQVWYCNKSPCQQQHDVVLVQVQAGNVPAALRAGQPGQLVDPPGVPNMDEVLALRKRVVELEQDNARLRRQSTAPPESEKKAAEMPPHIVAQKPEKKATVHVDDGAGKPLCGARFEPDTVKLPESLEFSDVVCDGCVEAWTARNQSKPEDRRTVADALSAPPKDETPVRESELAPQVRLPQPESPMPEIQDYSKLQKFDRHFIARVNDGAEVDGPILLTQEIYPDIDFGKIKPSQLRRGISGFFAHHEVDAIRRAEADGKVIGVVFTLRFRTPVDSAFLTGQKED